MKRTVLVSVLLSCLLLPTALFAQTVKITKKEREMADAITASQLRSYLTFIASDAMGGRDTPSVGLDITAEFIRMNLEKWGFKPAGDNGTFFQKIALRRDQVDAAKTQVLANGQAFSYGDDLVRLNGSGDINAPILFVGDGWMVKSKGIDPYAGLDVKGKVLAVYSTGALSGGSRNLIAPPQGVTPDDLKGTRGTDWADVATYAMQKGAAGVLILPSPFLAENWAGITQSFGRSRMVVDKLTPASASPARPGVSIMVASPKLAEAIFAGEAGVPMQGYNKPFALSANKLIDLKVATKADIAMTQNVVAVWEGSDPVLKNEFVAVGAHYDHVGTNPNAPGADKIWNGADDDGSGTTAVLAIAEALAKAPTRPKRSILFVWHAGEEKGLWGSAYFNKFPTVDIKNVIAQLNIDMIGRSKAAGDTNEKNKELSGPNEVYVIGKDMMSTTLGAIVDGTNKAYDNLTYNTRYDAPNDPNRFFFRSDHFNYAVNGIPVAFWFTGVHEDYHGAGDTADKIDYAKMEKISRTIFLTLVELADLGTRPAVDKTLPPELSAPR